MVSEEFARAVREEVEKMLPEDRKGATIWTENILKDADRTLTGLCVREKGASEYPRVYLEDFEKALRYGQTFSSVMQDIMDALEESRQMQQLSNTARDVTRDPEEARRRVSYRILNYGRNIQNITTRPYRVQGEFVYVYSLELGNGGRIPIDKNLADKLDLKEPELYELARKNSPVVTPAEVLTIGQALGFPGQHPDDMMVISNTEHADGAVAVLYPEVDAQLRERFGGDYYVLPSSVHEVLAVPREPERLHALEEMVRSVNASGAMRHEDYLSDHVFEVKDGQLMRAMPERVAEKTVPVRNDLER